MFVVVLLLDCSLESIKPISVRSFWAKMFQKPETKMTASVSTKGITPKICRLCFCPNKQRSFEPFIRLALASPLDQIRSQGSIVPLVKYFKGVVVTKHQVTYLHGRRGLWLSAVLPISLESSDKIPTSVIFCIYFCLGWGKCLPYLLQTLIARRC